MSKTGIFKEIKPFAILIKNDDKIEQEVINEFENLDEEIEVPSQKVKQHSIEESFISSNIALIIGIIFLPCVFSWFSLKKWVFSNLENYKFYMDVYILFIELIMQS